MMDKKKVKKKKDRKNNGQKKKREKRPKKGSRRFRTRVELRALDEKNKKQIFLPHFTHRLPCPPKRRKRRDEIERRRKRTVERRPREIGWFVRVHFVRVLFDIVSIVLVEFGQIFRPSGVVASVSMDHRLARREEEGQVDSSERRV